MTSRLPALIRPARPKHRPTHRLALLTLLVASLACGTSSKDSASQTYQGGDAPAVAPEVSAAVALQEGAADQVGRKAAPSGNSAGSPQSPSAAIRDSVIPSMIIRNGSASIEVDSLEVAIASVRGLAGRLGGYVGNVSMSTGQFEVRSATLELKIPASRFDEALTGLTPVGKVEFSQSTAEDVGEEFVDITARTANAKRLEDRLVTLLATRTGKLEDVLAVERELARVREEIERYDGRLRYLKSRVATSTLSVTVHEKAPLVNPNPGTNVIAQAFRDMWRNFVGFVATLIESLGVLIPVALLIFIGIAAWKRFRRPPTATP